MSELKPAVPGNANDVQGWGKEALPSLGPKGACPALPEMGTGTPGPEKAGPATVMGAPPATSTGKMPAVDYYKPQPLPVQPGSIKGYDADYKAK